MDDHQLLAHLIALAGTGETAARASAHAMLERYLSLEQVLSLSPEKLLQDPALDEHSAVFLLLLPALIERYGVSPVKKPLRLWDRSDLEALILPHFYGHSVERVYAFFLDENMDLITAVLCAQGGSGAVSCSVRRVMELALNHRAQGVILAHNHPDGTAVFSRTDLMSTTTLAQELALVDIPLLDHFLLAGEQIVSLRKLVGERKLASTVYPLPREWFSPQ